MFMSFNLLPHCFLLGALHAGSCVGLWPAGALSWGLLVLGGPRAPASAEHLVGWVWGESLWLHCLWPWTLAPLSMDGHPLVAFPHCIQSAKPFVAFINVCVLVSVIAFLCVLARMGGTFCKVEVVVGVFFFFLKHFE